jgi:hypothetical protein
MKPLDEVVSCNGFRRTWITIKLRYGDTPGEWVRRRCRAGKRESGNLEAHFAKGEYPRLVPEVFGPVVNNGTGENVKISVLGDRHL